MNRRTHVRFPAVALAATAVIVGLGSLAPGAGAGPERALGRPAALRTYTVRPGDTLWGIAVRAVGPERDPRPFVDRLIEKNHMEGALIRAGQRLILPP